MAENSKGRRRKLKTVRETAKEQLQQQQRPTPVKQLLRLVFWPFVSLYRWLAQPVHIHEQKGGEDSWAGSWTKERSLAPAYVRHSFFEMKMVVWPPFNTAMRLTVAVFIFALFFAGLVAFMDWVLTQIFEEVILNKGENIRNLF